jgi:16S rRNA (uracil1498-N3)-methyltransferase
MTIRLFVESPLHAGRTLVLPAGAARHARVRRVQPGDALLLFDGSGAEWPAVVVAVGRSEVTALPGPAHEVDRELPWPVTLAVGMPANDRMDQLVEKATELGAARIQPLVCDRSVLRLAGARALRKRDHWQAIATAASEQCGRSRVPVVEPVAKLAAWLGTLKPGGQRLLLSPRSGAVPLRAVIVAEALWALSGPEGGFTDDEEDAAHAAGFTAVGLGARVLRADTAPLALLAWVGLQA